MRTVRQNLRYAIRLLSKAPGFTLAIILTLALGIGAATTVFSIAESVLWKPLAFTDSERLVAIFGHAASGHQDGLVSELDFFDWQVNAQAFRAMAAYGGGENRTVTGGAEVARVPVDTVSTNFFSALGTVNIRGRDFLPQESTPGLNQVAIVSAQFWERQFPAMSVTERPNIRLDDLPFEIVGVLPRDIRLENFGLHDIITPLPIGSNSLPQARDARTVEVVGRLKDRVSIAQAQSDLDTVCHQLSLLYPATNLNWGATVQSLRESIVSKSFRTTLRLFVGSSILLLLAACLNAAGLLLAKTLDRRQQFAVRAALGAGQKILIEQLLAESVLLGGIGGLLGIAFAWWGTRAFTLVAASSNMEVPRLREISLDPWVLGFAAAISVLVMIVMGVVPAHAGTTAALREAFQATSRTATPSRQNQRLQNLFVVTQFALATVLLVGTGLFTRSLVRLQNLDPGFDPRGVLSGYISLSSARYTDPSRVILFSRQLEAQV